jgi:hypothetical protein
MLLTNIPTDLIYDIFLLLDSHVTLTAFITTNRLLYEIFKTYSNVILRRVLCNEFGMDIQVLPYAWATFSSQQRGTEEIMEGDIQPQKHSIIGLTPFGLYELKAIHATVQRLARLYSIR